jgi:Flp pilus assembly pilin Flp
MKTRLGSQRIPNVMERDRCALINSDERRRHEPSVVPIRVRQDERNMHPNERKCRSTSRRGASHMINLLFSLIDRLTAQLRNSERGEVSLEYVLVGGLMAVAIVGSIGLLSGSLSDWFTSISGTISDAVTP